MLPAFEYATYVLGPCIVLLNTSLLIWRIRRRHEDAIHSLSVCSIAAANLITGLYFHIFISVNVLDTDANSKSLKWDIVRQFAGVVAAIGLHANLGFVFLKIVDRTICLYHAFNVIGMTSRWYSAYSIMIWVVSILLSLTPFLPVKYFREFPYSTDFSLITSWLIYTEPGWEDYAQGWHFVMATNVIFHGGVHLAGIVLLAITGSKVSKTPPEMMTQQRRIEISFFYQILGVAVVDIACWAPNIVLAVAACRPSDPDDSTPWRVFLDWAVLFAGTAHALMNPVLLLMSECCNRPTEDTSILREKHSSQVNTVWRNGEQRVSIRLSHYLASGQALSPQEAVIMTSSLSHTVGGFHKLGMAANTIDPEHIYVEQDTKGTLVNSQLVGVPVKPTEGALGDHVTRNKEAIGQLFGTLMTAFHATTRMLSSGQTQTRSRSVCESNPRSVKSRLRTRSERNFRSNLDPVASVNVTFGEEPAFPRERPISIRSRIEQLEDNFKTFKKQRLSVKYGGGNMPKRGFFSRLSNRSFSRASCKSNWGDLTDFEMSDVGDVTTLPSIDGGDE